MRVLQVHNSYRQPGGEDRVVDAEAALLETAGHDVRRVLVDNPTGWRTPAALATSVWNPSVPGRLRRVARQFGAEVAHVHNTWFSLTAAAVSGPPCPVVMTLHNFRLACSNALLFRDGTPCSLCVEGSAFNGVRYGCYRGLITSVPAAVNVGFHRWRETWQRHVGLFIALSDFSRQVFIKSGLPPDRITVKPNFVEDPGPRSSPAYHSDTLLYVGRLSVEKGVGLLAKAIRQVGNRFRWSIVGDGPLRKELEGIPGVDLLGWLPRRSVDHLMQASRALILPSLTYENQPMAAIEAFAASLPVLASNHGGLAETVAPLGEMSLFPAGDLDGLVTGITALEDDHLIERAAAAARRTYRERHSPAVGLKQLEAIYQATIARGPGPHQ